MLLTNLLSVNQGSDFTKADLAQTNFAGADFEKVNLTDARNLTLEQLQLANNWQYALYSDDFRKSVLCESPAIAFPKDLLDQYLETKDFSCFSLYGSDLLQGKDLSNGDLSQSNLTNANFQNTNLTNTNLQATDLICTDLRGAIGLTVEQILQASNASFAIYDDDFRAQLLEEIELRDPQVECDR